MSGVRSGEAALQVFADRREAGRLLGTRVADHLRRTGFQGCPLVLGLPRGGVPVAYAVAEAVGGELDVTVARKIGLPGQPEYGIGAVTPEGPPLLNRRVLAQFGLTDQNLASAVARERAEAVRRLSRYRQDRPAPRIADRLVVLVDDGLATGVTARAALRSVRAARPSRVVFAAPVCAADSAATVSGEADAVVCVHCPADLGAVGAWYRDFTQVSDAEVEQILATARRR